MRTGLVATTACAVALAAGGVLAAPASAITDGPQHPGQARASFFAWTQNFRDGKGDHLVIADAGGKHERVLTHPGPGASDSDARISPDGRIVLFERDTDKGSAPAVVRVDGTHEHVLNLRCTDPCAFPGSASWAPNGRQIVYNRSIGPIIGTPPHDHFASNVLYRSDLDGRHRVRISEPGIDGMYEDSVASFAPAGYMVFLRLRTSDNATAVFRTTDNRDRPRQLTPWSLVADLPAVSPARVGPTKDLVVFETYGSGPPDGYSQAVATVPTTCRSLAACTARIRTLTPTTPRSATDFTECFNPSWSPDGRSIAYVAFEYRKGANKALGQIRTMRFDGTHKRVLSHDPYFDYRPAWGLLPVKKAAR